MFQKLVHPIYIFFVLTWASPLVWAIAEPKEASGYSDEYDQVYLLEQSQVRPAAFQTSFSYRHDVSNPYLSLHGLSLSAATSAGRFVRIGLEGTRYYSSASQLTSSLNNDLQAQGIDQRIHRPDYSLYAMGWVIPFEGRFLFFSSKPVRFALPIALGVGSTHYLAETWQPAFTWGFRPTVGFAEHWDVLVGFDQQIESPFGARALTRSEIQAGVSAQW